MRHYAAREIMDEQGQGTGRWRYTVKRDGDIRAVGYCGNLNCEGHGSPEEAREHYRQYLLAENLRFNGVLTNTKRQCAVKDCGEWTQNLAYIAGASGRSWPLCDAHRNTETVDKLLKVNESWES